MFPKGLWISHLKQYFKHGIQTANDKSNKIYKSDKLPQRFGKEKKTNKNLGNKIAKFKIIFHKARRHNITNIKQDFDLVFSCL